MWAIYTVIVYFALALLLPVGWVLVPVWRRARAERQVACPDAGATAADLAPLKQRGVAVRVGSRDHLALEAANHAS